MKAKQKRKVTGPEQSKRAPAIGVPQFFRLNVEVGDLQSAISFYTTLMGIQGRKQAGSRCYFECGPVTLQVLDVSSSRQPHPAAKALYFTVNNLEEVYERAKSLKCLSAEDVHEASGSGIAVRPWGSGPFTSKTPGRIHCVLSRREQFTQGRAYGLQRRRR
jgi:hypothetical protein